MMRIYTLTRLVTVAEIPNVNFISGDIYTSYMEWDQQATTWPTTGVLLRTVNIADLINYATSIPGYSEFSHKIVLYMPRVYPTAAPSLYRGVRNVGTRNPSNPSIGGGTTPYLILG